MTIMSRRFVVLLGVFAATSPLWWILWDMYTTHYPLVNEVQTFEQETGKRLVRRALEKARPHLSAEEAETFELQMESSVARWPSWTSEYQKIPPAENFLWDLHSAMQKKRGDREDEKLRELCNWLGECRYVLGKLWGLVFSLKLHMLTERSTAYLEELKEREGWPVLRENAERLLAEE
jgi:hypothetical protein